MTVHCKKCDGLAFPTIRKLRIHQWSAHREAYNKVGFPTNNKGWTKAQHAKYQATIEARRSDDTALIVRPIEPVQEMTARALLQKVKNQATFMHDVVSLLEGIIK